MKHQSLSRNVRRGAALALIACTLSSSSLALADEPPADSAQEQYRRANELMDRQEWPEARRILLELWQRSKTYDVAASLSEIEYELKNYAGAAQYMKFAVANIPPFEKQATVDQYKASFQELKGLVGTARITVSQPDAEVFVDNELVGKSPLPEEVFLNVGPHTVEAKLGDQVAAKTVDILAGANEVIAFELAPSATAASTSPAPPLAPTNDAKHEEASPAKPIALWTGAGLTVLAAGIGVGFFVKASSAQSDVDDLKERSRAQVPSGCSADSSVPICQDLSTATDERNSASMVSRISFIASGVFLAGTAATFFLWPDKQSGEANLRPRLLVGREGAGLTLRGDF